MNHRCHGEGRGWTGGRGRGWGVEGQRGARQTVPSQNSCTLLQAWSASKPCSEITSSLLLQATRCNGFVDLLELQIQIRSPLDHRSQSYVDVERVQGMNPQHVLGLNKLILFCRTELYDWGGTQGGQTDFSGQDHPGHPSGSASDCRADGVPPTHNLLLLISPMCMSRHCRRRAGTWRGPRPSSCNATLPCCQLPVNHIIVLWFVPAPTLTGHLVSDP